MKYDNAVGITWNGKIIEKTVSETLEIYCGPGLVVFNIPFQIGEYISTAIALS
jgi:hypothetical protein